jgi:glutamate--cysteine ligase
MSTTLPDVASDISLDPISLSDLTSYFQNGGKVAAAWRVGAEFETFVVERATGRALSYDEPGGIRDLLQTLSERFGWQPHYRGDRLTLLTRAGSMVSLEPGGQVEFSSPPVAHLDDLAAELHRHRTEVRAVVDTDRVAVIAAGVTPFAPVEDIPPPVRRRHALMAEYLPPRCPMAKHMMQATASTQAAFDYADEADAMRKFALGLTLGPVINAIWGNSPLYGGEPTGWVSYRGRVWLGMDPDRSGLLPQLLAEGLSFDRWVNYLLDVPMLFTVRDGNYYPAGGRTFRDFLAHGIDGRFPTLADWEVHITTVFPEVRLKQFLEVRGADANSPPLALAVPAFWKGLFYDADALTAAEAIASNFRPADLPTVFEMAARDGLVAKWSGHTLARWAGELTEIAREGLRKQTELSGAADERSYLDPVKEVLGRGRSPGAVLAAMRPLTCQAVLASLEV